ncbi:bifunctional adenosylcobinamide kinase/adenosylcobinamide-phosphate guanylyltransferase [Amaricoccus macauensis]|uniref:bifunctional adenosylcobinamide kinase/adenosylcobinamide-phosphate guanylyltransferase n=1 Tax=Amaricoccus macauensis TaxID=57001 RepID=UPI003C7BA0AD
MALTDHRLVLGGARSGKTRHAMALAEATGPRRLYIATAEAHDAEMAERIARHKAERGAGWQSVEAPLDIVSSFASFGTDAILVDCLTLWLSNLMHSGRNPEIETGRFIEGLRDVRSPIILVSNEVGLGLVPETPLGRAFRDEQGRLNQRIAAAVGSVDFIAAGLPVALKRPEPSSGR